MRIKPPSVTTILRDLGLIDYSRAPEEAVSLKLALGTDVHRLCEMPVTKRLPDSPALDYARSFRRWLSETGATVLRSEFSVRGSVNGHKYVGRCDLEFAWEGERWIADLKTGSIQTWHTLQLVGYARAMRQSGQLTFRRGVLELRPSSAKLIPICNAGDSAAWEACVELWYWKHNHR